jgi:hypothetical protein
MGFACNIIYIRLTYHVFIGTSHILELCCTQDVTVTDPLQLTGVRLSHIYRHVDYFG